MHDARNLGRLLVSIGWRCAHPVGRLDFLLVFMCFRMVMWLNHFEGMNIKNPPDADLSLNFVVNLNFGLQKIQIFSNKPNIPIGETIV